MIVEIGDKPVIAKAFPAETLFFATLARMALPDDVRTLDSLGALWRALGRPDVDLVVCHPTFSAPWSWRHLSRQVFSRRFLSANASLLCAFGPQLLRWRRRAPIVVLDYEDMPVISRSSLFLLDRCRLYFKRELPQDRWRVFMKTVHANLPTRRFRTDPRNLARIDRLRPLSLGLPLNAEALLDRPPPAAKTADIFFAGRVEGSSSLRRQGLEELQALAGAGVRVDIPDAPLLREEFYRRCGAAWLVWSPEGYGWDCFRHYEALACGSVPLMNLPGIERRAPLIADEHGLYYDAEPGGLTRAAQAALADKAALMAIAERGRAHVLAHHTPLAIAREIVEAGRGRP